MKTVDSDVFFELLKAGLWGAEKPDLRKQGFTGGIDWIKVYKLAEEQSVVGLVLAGLEHSDVPPPSRTTFTMDRRSTVARTAE